MFNFDFSRHLLRLQVMALLGLALAARHSHACPKPSKPIEDGFIPTSVFEEEYADGSTITYECLPGFARLRGSSVRTCNNGKWSDLTLQCRKKSCGAPPDVLNGQWIAEDILFGTTITLECNTGYKVRGKISTMQCEAGGWNGKGFVCEEVTCPEPEVKFGWQVEGQPPYVHKSFIVYKCDEGYQMKGSSKIVCEGKVWSSEPPVCEKTCPKPSKPIEDGFIPTSVSEEEYADGSTITYECLPDFARLRGSSVRTCNNGTWSDLTLQCIRQSCSAPPDVLNGQWIVKSIPVGATITLECNTGYTVGGKISTMRCEAGGWNRKAFACEAVKCPLPEQILNGKSSLDGNREYLLYQESVLYTCDKSYTLSGESELRCTENGTYNAEPPECKRVNCSQPEVKFGWQVEGRPPYVHKSFIVYKCDEGYQMKGSSKIVCENNGWSSEPPVCKKSDASGTGSLRTEVYSALAQRVVMALLIPVGLHLAL